ncbi:UNVERIFIED_ORG: hypothetical protein ABIB13_002224 [Arthrobacter sp. UYEF2]
MTTTLAAPAPKFTTRLVYIGFVDAEDRDTRDDSHPVCAATGDPEFGRFRGEWHVEDWVKFGPANVGVKLPAWYADLDAQAARREQYEDFLRGQEAL